VNSPAKIPTPLLLPGVLLALTAIPTLGQAAASPKADAALPFAYTTEPSGRAAFDAAHAYTLAELIDIAEQNAPEAAITWQHAKAAAAAMGLARAEYLPRLAGFSVMSNEKLINPFPRPLAPHGYTMVEMPVANAGLTADYTVLDFGRRRAHLDAARATKLAAAAHFERANQMVAFEVIAAYYQLRNATATLEARRQILTTAQTIEAAAQAQLDNGRATLPDLLDAKAGSAKADFELEAAIGGETQARVALRKAIGVAPSDAILLAEAHDDEFATSATEEIHALLETAAAERADLVELSQRVQAAQEHLKAANRAWTPTVELGGRGSVESIWPTVSKDHGSLLADTTHFVWQSGLTIHWDFFDGGVRRSHAQIANAELRAAEQNERAGKDAASQQTWSAFVECQTAERRRKSAQALLEAATASYSASLDAYGYGVKNLIDLVHAESQLAEARLAQVEATSALRMASAKLSYATGELLRKTPTTAKSGESTDK